MIPRECKRLAEVDFPIAVVSRHAAREKATPDCHPFRLHLWWARRPLAACRAILMALLLPDPCDAHCPAEFKAKARELFSRSMLMGAVGKTDEELRRALLRFIGDFANWENAANAPFLEVGRGLVRAAHAEDTPLVVDPFAGGGSIPLEALRIGCDAFASDLNPVACMILKVLLEEIPRHGARLAEELRHAGAEIQVIAEKELHEFYPDDSDGARPIAYLWSRTVRCEAPKCGAEIPLARSWWLAKNTSRRRALRHRVVHPASELPRVEFEVFEPSTEREVPPGTVMLAKATCLACGTVLPPERVRAQLSTLRGGASVIFDGKNCRTGGARMLAVVTTQPGVPGRQYRLATERDYAVVSRAQERLARVQDVWVRGGRDGACPVPDEPVPQDGTGSLGGGYRTRKYGILAFGDFFSGRQLLSLVTLVRLVRETAGTRESLRALMALALDRVAMSNVSCTRWNASAEKMQHAFGRQALPIVWDFAEVAPFANAPGSWRSGYELICDVLDRCPSGGGSGQTQLADACHSPLTSESSGIWFTDPPYYDSVPYADLSDFFYVWLKRAVGDKRSMQDPFDPENPLTPKSREAVQDLQAKGPDGTPKDSVFYESAMTRAFVEGRRLLSDGGAGCVVFAHKTTEGWEALLSGLVRGGWTITGSWPIATEMGTRLRARESAALATSVHLLCRPRLSDASVGDWGDVVRELPKRVRDWMDRLEREGVRGADLVFACIGPALEVYSRYAKVVDSEDREIPLGGDPGATEPCLRGFLTYVWEVVGRTALERVLGTSEGRARNGAAGALEEDARLTALFLWTLQTTESEPAAAKSEEDDEDEDGEEEGSTRSGAAKGFSLIYDVARRFAQPLGIHLDDWEGRIIETSKGVVRLLAVSERAEQLFGKEGASAVADQIEQTRSGPIQLTLFPQGDGPAPKIRGRGKGRTKKTGGSVPDEKLQTQREATTLDRVHAAMLLQSSGRTHALRALMKAEVERGPDFVRLVNSLSALYPNGSEERRLLEAMVHALPR